MWAGALGCGMSARLAPAHRALFNRAFLFIGAMLPRAQRAVSISGAVHLDLAPSAAPATFRVWSDTFENLDIVAATEQLQSALAKAVEDRLPDNREGDRRDHHRSFLEVSLGVRQLA